MKDNAWPAIQLGFVPSLFFNEGWMWGRSRRIIAPSLSAHNVLDMLPAMAQVSPPMALLRVPSAADGSVLGWHWPRLWGLGVL